MSTLSRKAWGDLTRHRARTLLAVCTLSIAIASLGFLAVPALLNAAMNRQIAGSHLYDVGISTSTLDLSPAQLRALGRLPGVAAVSPAVGYATTATSAAGTQDVALAGTALASAPVNTVALFTGRMPGPGEVLADAGNGRATGFAVPVGGTIDVRAASGRLVRLRVSGTGLNLAATPGANGSTTPVFYAPTATVQALRGVRGYNYLGFRLTDDAAAAQSRVVAEVRAYLTAQTGTDPITALPAVRAPGQWPGQSGFGQIMALLYIITILAFASALFLISATMNTLIAEQAGEIAILKTLGGRRRQIAGITVRTAAMLGAAGAVLGTILGIAIAYLLAGYFAVKLIDVSFGFAISVPVVVASLVLGPALAVAASLPALRRALRRPVAETLAGAGTSGLRLRPARPPGRAQRPAGRDPGARQRADGSPQRAAAKTPQHGHDRAGRRGRRARDRLPRPRPVDNRRHQPDHRHAALQHRRRGGSEQRRAAVRRPGARRRRRHTRRHRTSSPSRPVPCSTTGRPTWRGAWARIPSTPTG